MCEALEKIIEEKLEERGIKHGISQGVEHAKECISQLTSRLLEEQKYKELERASRDTTYWEELFAIYGV